MLRLALRNQSHGVEFPDSHAGKLQIKAFRLSHSEFKGRHIRAILQLMPDDMPCGIIYKLNQPAIIGG